MGTIRNISLAVAAGSLLAAGYAMAEEAGKPSDTPRTEQHRHGGQGMAGQGCMGGEHARMGDMQGRMAERHGRMGMQHGAAGECGARAGESCPAVQEEGEHRHDS